MIVEAAMRVWGATMCHSAEKFLTRAVCAEATTPPAPAATAYPTAAKLSTAVARAAAATKHALPPTLSHPFPLFPLPVFARAPLRRGVGLCALRLPLYNRVLVLNNVCLGPRQPHLHNMFTRHSLF